MSAAKQITPLYLPTFFETRSGLTLDFLNPKPEDFTIDDIAFGLSRINRFCGQTNIGSQGYSVALHSHWVANYIYIKTGNPTLALYGLLHDAHEAYTGDIPTPLKNVQGVREVIEPVQAAIQSAIHCALGLSEPTSDATELIKLADKQALISEASYFKKVFFKHLECQRLDDVALTLPLLSPCSAINSHSHFINAYWDLADDILHVKGQD